MGDKQENMAETNKKWQKTDKNDRKTFKMLIITNYLPTSFPFLFCQASISVLPNSLFCPAKLSNFSKGGPRPPRPPPPNTPMIMATIMYYKIYVHRKYVLCQCQEKLFTVCNQPKILIFNQTISLIPSK